MLAMAARKAVGADALVAGPVVDACGAILAHSSGASVEFVLTTDADVVAIASAVEA